MHTLVLFFRLVRPLFLLGAALMYALGVGIANYLGYTIEWGIYLLGQAWVTILQLSALLLNEYFNVPQENDNQNRTPYSGGSRTGEGGFLRITVLLAGLTCLALLASLTIILIQTEILSPAIYLVMVLAFCGAFFYSVPPINLVATGYGELTASILVANLLPAFSYLLQTAEIHRLLTMSTFPLTALYLAMMLIFELPDYANDIKFGKRTLMVRIGWQRGMVLHNSLILVAYLLLGLAVAFGLPSSIALPAFLTIPLGLLQVWHMRRIADGFKPNWRSLTLTSVVLFASVAYLLTYAFWTR